MAIITSIPSDSLGALVPVAPFTLGLLVVGLPSLSVIEICLRHLSYRQWRKMLRFAAMVHVVAEVAFIGRFNPILPLLDYPARAPKQISCRCGRRCLWTRSVASYCFVESPLIVGIRPLESDLALF